MKSHTYYDILGVSRDATLDEITTAKNALAKVYHPDANAHKNIDTTAFMQEILEAYRVLSNPEKRRKYNQETFGETELRKTKKKIQVLLSHIGICLISLELYSIKAFG